MRPLERDHGRIRLEERLHDLDAPEHRGAEDVHPRAAREQERGDVGTPHVRGAAEARLPVASAPVPRRVDEARLGVEQGLRALQVAVRHPDEVLDRVGGQSRGARDLGAGRVCLASADPSSATPADRPERNERRDQFVRTTHLQ